MAPQIHGSERAHCSVHASTGEHPGLGPRNNAGNGKDTSVRPAVQPDGGQKRKAGSSRSCMEVCETAINLQSGGPSASAAIIERARSPAMGTDGRLQQCCCCCCSRSCSCRAAVCRWPQRKSAALDEFKSMARAFSLTCSLPFSDLSLLHGQGPGPRAQGQPPRPVQPIYSGRRSKTAIIWIDRVGSRLPSRPGMGSVNLCTCAERLFCSVSGCFNSV